MKMALPQFEIQRNQFPHYEIVRCTTIGQLRIAIQADRIGFDFNFVVRRQFVLPLGQKSIIHTFRHNKTVLNLFFVSYLSFDDKLNPKITST